MKLLPARIIVAVFLCITIMAFMPHQPVTEKPIYLNTAYSFRERAADLVSRMTLEEKMSQLGNTMAAIPRLGVNKYDVWGEALHGVVRHWGDPWRDKN